MPGSIRRIQGRFDAPFQAWLLHSVLVYVTVGVTGWLTPGRDHLRPRIGGIADALLGPLSIWDGAWYLRIADEGYAERQSSAFFPLYPIVIRAVSSLTGLSLRDAGALISSLAFFGALKLLHRLVHERYGSPIANRTVWLLALTPFAFFFSAVYTESLFLFLTLLTVAVARDGRWTLAAIGVLLATLTRSAGVFVIVPVAFALIEQRGLEPRRLYKPALQLAAGLAGPIVFAAHLRKQWHDPLLMSSIQSEWGRAFAWPWTTIWTALDDARMHFIVPRAACTQLVQDGHYDTCLAMTGINWDTLSDDFALISLMAAIPLLIVATRRLAPAESIYAALLLIFPLFNPSSLGPLMSMPRYALVIWPLFVALAMVLHRRRVFVISLATSATLMCLILALHASAFFVS